jgi:phosphopantothenate---cysteine ligase (CTP)
MHCIVTAGPSIEALDQVRRLTNFSSGRLGVELGNFLTSSGHEIALLLGEQATWPGESRAAVVERFGSAANLRERLQKRASGTVGAVFHAAAVADFAFGKIWSRSDDGTLKEMRAGKLSTRNGVLLAELVPTPKIISELRTMFPQSVLVGWKYEVDGERKSAIQAAIAQLAACATDACVANGPAYGAGFGLVQKSGQTTHLKDHTALFIALEAMLRG